MFANLRPVTTHKEYDFCEYPMSNFLLKIFWIVDDTLGGMWWLVLMVFLKTRKHVAGDIYNGLPRLGIEARHILTVVGIIRWAQHPVLYKMDKLVWTLRYRHSFLTSDSVV